MPASAIRLSLTLLTGLIALLGAGWVDVLADEATEPIDPALVTLEPGENLIGWLGEELPVDQLMRRFPVIESVAAWEPLSGRFYEPTSLLAGQGYVVTLSGTESVQWRRPMTPVKGKITLYRGRNLVTWLGPDGWTIDRVVLGIGRSLVRAQWEGGEYSPADAATSEPLPTLKRGAALWVEVSRAVNWLQPAGVKLPIVFAGDISADVKAAIRKDSADAMSWFADEYGIQPDGSAFTAYFAADVESFIKAWEDDGRNINGMRFNWHRSLGQAGPDYVWHRAEMWEPDYPANAGRTDSEYAYGRAVLAHEYYHAVQHQLGGLNDDAPSWLVEGDAQWQRARLLQRDAGTEQAKELLEDRQQISSDDAPPLEQIVGERVLAGWEYSVGTVASWRVALRSGVQSLVEFWRVQLPEPMGPLGRWESKPPWQVAFRAAFGISVDDFYDEFAAWRSGSASLRGRVVGPDGEGLPYVNIAARTEHVLDGDRYHSLYTRTDANGEFELAVSGDGGVQWGVDFGGCLAFYTSSGLAHKWEDAQVVTPSAESEPRISLALSENTCVRRVSGLLADEDGKPINEVRVLGESEQARIEVPTNADGEFVLAVPRPDSYRLSVWLDEHDCRVYYRRGDSAGSHRQATEVKVNDRDVSGVQFQLTDGLCSMRISGRLLDASGMPIPGASVWAQSDEGGHGSAGTDSDGEFAIAVSEAGRYRVSARIDGCSIRYRRGGVTGTWDQATRVPVADKGVSGLTMQLAEGMCERRMSGRLLSPDGSPHPNQWVRACGSEGCGGATSGADGSFAFAVPASGSYRLETDFGDCRIHRGTSGPTTNWRSARQVRVSNADVTGIEFRLPENPSGFCN